MIEFDPKMNVSFDTALGRVSVKWSASAWRTHMNYRVTVDAPFLLVPLEVGERGFSPLAKALNRLLRSGCNGRMAEFLELAALGNATHWLSTLERLGIEATLARLRKVNRKLEKYRELAWKLKKKGYAVTSRALLVRGARVVYPILKGSGELLRPAVFNLHPKDIKAMEKSLEQPRESNTNLTTLFLEDEPAKRALRRALREIGEPWIEKVEARFADALGSDRG